MTRKNLGRDRQFCLRLSSKYLLVAENEDGYISTSTVCRDWEPHLYTRNAYPVCHPWFPAAYSLTVGTFILVAGRLGDLYGHRLMFISGFLWYALWSLLAGFSVHVGTNRVIFFDCCRALQGIGPAFALPNAIAILGRVYPPGLKKQLIFSAFGATAPSGFLVGAVFSSLLAEKVWWPWAYWITAIVCLLTGIAAFFVVPHTPPPELDDSETTWARTDALGAITGISGLVLFNFAWNQAPVVGWQDPYIYILLIVGILFCVAFGFVESRVSKFPLVPLEVMTTDTLFVLACVGLGWAGFGIWVYYFWQFLEELRGLTPPISSAEFVPTAISGFCAAVSTGILMSHVKGSVVMIIALVAFTVGLILVATAPVDQTYWAQTFVSLIVMPWGMDMSFPAANLLLSNKMPKEHQGVSASLVNTVINYSISLALGIAGTVQGHVDDDGTNTLKGYRGAWYLAIGLAGFGAILAGIYGLKEAREKKMATPAKDEKN